MLPAALLLRVLFKIGLAETSVVLWIPFGLNLWPKTRSVRTVVLTIGVPRNRTEYVARLLTSKQTLVDANSLVFIIGASLYGSK